ncbi:hypothetical protein FSP39_002647 [Pinctada imbricata]|uniref:Uncharacterized protein n=1 Tax=Pinctada imbricata TaxID=66713 RepID=A0AA89CAI2_PINIB|nr:hypothetical protein FSP39_002647 [Pinctada imbricata]
MLFNLKTFTFCYRSDSDDGKLVVDGVDVNTLNNGELMAFTEAEDEKLAGELDIRAGKKALEDEENSNGKRALPLAPIAARVAWVAGRRLFRSALTRFKPILTRSGKRLTKQYRKRGSYRTAVRDFNSLRPTNGMRIRTGNIGRTKVTVRSSSSYGRPTMELRNPNRNFVRKFRYESRRSLRNPWG